MADFNPEPYFQAFQAGQQRKNNLVDALSSLPQYALKGMDEGQQMRHQKLMDQLAQAQGNREQQTYDVQNKPLVPPSQPSDTPYSSDYSPSQNQNIPSFGGLPNNSAPSGMSQPPQPAQASPMFGQKIQRPIVKNWLAMGPNHPYGPGQGGQSSNPEQPYLDILHNPSESPMRQKMASDALQRITQEEQTPYEKQGWQLGLEKTKSETAKNYAEANAQGGVSPQDMNDISGGNYQGIAGRHNGIVPSKLAAMGESSGLRQDQMYQTKLQRAQDSLTNIKGDQSISRTETQRDAAIQAYNTIQTIKSENRMPSKLEYYDLLGQMWKARTGAAPSDQAIKDLDATTFKGDLGRAYTYITGQNAGATTNDILTGIQRFAADSGMQADKLHEGYMAPRMSKITMGLKPEDQASLIGGRRGLSFQDATGYQPQQQNSDRLKVSNFTVTK